MKISQTTTLKDIGGGETARVDIYWKSEKGKILEFSINLSILNETESSDVYRIDTAHGSLHEHKFWKTEKPEKINLDYTEAFREKIDKVLENYMKWCILFKKNKSENYG